MMNDERRDFIHRSSFIILEMIPVKLALKNFLSYGENVEPLDFAEFHVACLSGNNGHGKSALLDAITWALWGEARKGPGQGKPDSDLLRLGTTDMQVEFDFDLEGNRYRIIRKYSKSKKSNPQTLYLQVFNETESNFISIGSTKIRETEEKITKLLRMTYNTFINSSFILQGRADEFIRKGPRDRKAILTEILELSRYDELNKLSKIYAQETEKTRDQLQRVLEDIDKELVHKETYRGRIEALELLLKELGEQIAENAGKLEALKEEKNLLMSKKRSLDDLNRQIHQLDSDLKIITKQIQEQQGEVEGYERVIRRREEILEKYENYEKLRKEEGDYTEKLKRLRGFEAERNIVEKAIQKAQHDLEKTKERWMTKQTDIQKRIQEAESILRKSEEIEQGYIALQEAHEQDEILEEKRNQQEELEEKERKVQQQIEGIKNQLQAEIQVLNHQAKDLREKVGQEHWQKSRLEQLQILKPQLEGFEKEKESATERGNQLKIFIGDLKNQIKFLEQEKIPETTEKLRILKKDPQAHCPVCESDLDEKKRAHLEAKLSDELVKAQGKKEDLERQLATEEAELSNLRARYKDIDKKLQELPTVRDELAKVSASYEEILTSKGKLLELGGKIEGLKEQIQKEIYALEYQETLKSIEAAKKALGYRKEEHQTIKRKVRELNHFEGDKAKLENIRAQHQKLYEDLPEIQEEISKVSEALADKNYAPIEQSQLKELQSKIQDLGYDEEAHHAVKDELQKYQHAPVEKNQLRQAEEKVNLVREALERSNENRTTKETLRKELLQKIEELREDLTKLPQLEATIQTLENQLKTGEKERDKKLEERGEFQSKYARCLELEEKKREFEAQLKVACKDQFLYEKLMIAFGKDGIQALIIENAIPELEDEANAILSQLTNNRTHISIESIRDKKDGGIKETLDIKVSDELGTRDVELYSGGESFRTNFALRIALSKLLANRSGTKLRTLFIDEGFGTQDTQGLEQLIEAIHAIQDDFDKILVITHLEALKNAFPVRIEVTKLPDVGSSYQIMR